jgi:hypothetical protein
MKELWNKIKEYLNEHKKEVMFVGFIVVILIAITLTSTIRLGQTRRLYADIRNELERTRDDYIRLEGELERERQDYNRLAELESKARESFDRLDDVTNKSIGTVQEAIGLIRKIRIEVIQMENIWNNSDSDNDGSSSSNDNISSD